MGVAIMGGMENIDKEWLIFVEAGFADMGEGCGYGREWGIWHI